MDKGLRNEGRKILIVDDDPDLISNMSFMLKNFSIETATHPADALEMLKQDDFSVILSDYQMPGMNGVEFLKKSIEIKPKAKRILVTAFVDLMRNEELWNQAKVHRVLSKPFVQSDLIEVIENALFESVMEEENEKLRKLALTDPVTGAANQRYFWDRLRSEFSRAQRFSRPLSVLILDIDGFKATNDEKGHLEGDSLLKNVADILLRETRQMDVVARYGGDEFAVIFPEIECEGAFPIAVRLRDKIFAECGVSLSGGLASLPPSASERELVAKADALLLKVKKASKGQIFK